MNKRQRKEAIQRHVEELEAIVRTRYPEAEFSVADRQAPVRGIWIEAYIDDEDAIDPVFDTVSNRVVDILIDEGLYFIVIPLPKPQPAQYSGTKADD